MRFRTQTKAGTNFSSGTTRLAAREVSCKKGKKKKAPCATKPTRTKALKKISPAVWGAEG